MKLVLVLMLSCSFALAMDGKVLVLKGKTLLNGKKVNRKAKISYGDKIIVGKKGLAIVKLKTGSTIKIKPMSNLTISKPKVRKKQTLYTYVLKYGEIFLDIKKEKNAKYRVKARNVAMGVRGTQFFVSSTRKKKKVWMCVNEGEVGVSFAKKPKDIVIVKAGQGVVIDSDKLPEVKNYEWTRGLNWKFKGKFEDVKDDTNIRELNYDLENFEYD